MFAEKQSGQSPQKHSGVSEDRTDSPQTSTEKGNSEMIAQLKAALRTKSNEVRSVNGEPPAQSPAKKGGRITAEIVKQRSRAELSRLSVQRNLCEEQEDFVRALEKGGLSENSRTQLVGMVETAGSSKRHTEQLVREQTAKDKLLNSFIPAADDSADDYFDFLRKRGEDDETNPDEEDNQ